MISRDSSGPLPADNNPHVFVLQVDSRIQCGAVPLCLVSARLTRGWRHSPKARDKHVLVVASRCRDLYSDQCACSNEFGGLGSEERPIWC